MNSITQPSGPVIYVSDRGDKYNVATMDTSHLVNVLGHHITQIETLKSLGLHSRLRARADMLQKVVQVLTDELIKRDVSLEEYLPSPPQVSIPRDDMWPLGTDYDGDE